MAPPRRRTKSVAPESKPFAMAASKGSMPTPGISAASPATRKEITRQQFFKGRPDVSDDRLIRRQTQADELRAFKQGLTIAPGTTNLYQEQAPTFNPMTGRYERTTLADKAQELAFKYGPTPREVAGDIGYGIKSIGSALGERISQGRIGMLGIAKDLFEQFTNSAAKAKDALVKGVNKLSDIDLEVLKKKDTGEYKFLSKKAEIQEVENLEKTQMTEFDKANIIRQGIEQLETTPITGTTTLPQQPPGFKVMPTGNAAPVPTGNAAPVPNGLSAPYFVGRVGSTPVPNNIQQAQNPNELRRALMENTMPNNFPQEKPYLMQQDDYYYQDKERFSPQGNQYLYAAEGGSVDNKLNDIQKKTNNIYGTGILSVR
jgi:hypothetical protein